MKPPGPKELQLQALREARAGRQSTAKRLDRAKAALTSATAPKPAPEATGKRKRGRPRKP